jgi:hypothetical protein
MRRMEEEQEPERGRQRSETEAEVRTGVLAPHCQHVSSDETSALEDAIPAQGFTFLTNSLQRLMARR